MVPRASDLKLKVPPKHRTTKIDKKKCPDVQNRAVYSPTQLIILPTPLSQHLNFLPHFWVFSMTQNLHEIKFIYDLYMYMFTIICNMWRGGGQGLAH